MIACACQVGCRPRLSKRARVTGPPGGPHKVLLQLLLDGRSPRELPFVPKFVVMARRPGVQKGPADGEQPPLVTDARFSAAQSDPVRSLCSVWLRRVCTAVWAPGANAGGGGGSQRFQKLPRKHAKVTIDARFKGMLNDPRFNSATECALVCACARCRGAAEPPPLRAVPTDERGRAHVAAPREDLRRYYRVEDEEDGAAEGGPTAEDELPAPAGGASALEKKLARLNRVARGEVARAAICISRMGRTCISQCARRWCTRRTRTRCAQPLRGRAGVGVTRAPQVTTAASLAADHEDGEAARARRATARLTPRVRACVADEGVGAAVVTAGDIPDAAPEYGEEATARLALVNVDWDKLRAADIFAALASFVPAVRARSAVVPA